MGVDSSWKGMIKAGGVSLITGAAILVIFLLFMIIFQVQLPDTANVVATLENPLPPALLFSLAAFGEFLLMPGVLGLYFSLKDINKNQVFLGTAVWLAAIPMFLVSRGQIISLVTIVGSYTATADATLRAAYLATAHLAIVVANVYAGMSLVLLGFGSILIGGTMLRGVFSKRIAYLAIIAGTLLVVGTFGVLIQFLVIAAPFGLILGGIWQMAAGVKLYKLG
jgi:hypothetical protein